MHNRCVIPLSFPLHRSRDRTSGSSSLIQKEIAEPPANQMTLLWQKIQVQLLGEQLTPPARASILGLCLCCSSAASRLPLAGLVSKTSSSPWLPSLPCLVADTGVMCEPQAYTRSQMMSLPQVLLQARCPFPLVSFPCPWVVYFPQPSYRSFSPALTIAVRTTLPLVQLCTDGLPSHWPLQKTLHWFVSEVTTWILSEHARYLSPLFSSPSLAGFGEIEATLSIFLESKAAIGSSRKTLTHEVCRNADTQTDIFLYVNYWKSRQKNVIFFPFGVRSPISSFKD